MKTNRRIISTNAKKEGEICKCEERDIECDQFDSQYVGEGDYITVKIKMVENKMKQRDREDSSVICMAPFLCGFIGHCSTR